MPGPGWEPILGDPYGWNDPGGLGGPDGINPGLFPGEGGPGEGESGESRDGERSSLDLPGDDFGNAGEDSGLPPC